MDQRTRPRIADIARAAGVSKTAVSFAFNKPDRLAPETASRIRSIADGLGYRPNPVARMLTQGKTLTLGVLTPQALSVNFSNPFFGTFSAGVAEVAEAAGYGLIFISPRHGSQSGAMDRAMVDGVVVVGLAGDHPEVEQIRRAGLPIVLVDSTASTQHSSVEIDDAGGARAAAEHLIGLGHRDVLIVAVEPPSSSIGLDPAGVMGRRLQAYTAAFGAVGIPVPDDHLIIATATVDGGSAAVRRAWDAGRRPTAILAMSDVMAIGAMRALRELGVRVPEDVSVIGFDDIDLASHVDPPLTTVHQPIRGKGEEAVRLLLARIEGGGDGRSEHRRLATHLVVRGSTGPSAR